MATTLLTIALLVPPTTGQKEGVILKDVGNFLCTRSTTLRTIATSIVNGGRLGIPNGKTA